MYKKRFAKWGFRKNPRCSQGPVVTLVTKGSCTRLPRRQYESVGALIPMPATPQLGHDDSLVLSLLTSVREWSLAFFESVIPSAVNLTTLAEQQWSENAKETSFALKLVSDLLDRGHGAMAGRMLRKVFLLIEDMLTFEAPLLIWNLLEMMYHIVMLGHEQLFHTLLAHLVALVNKRMSKAHPLSVILHKIRGLAARLPSAVVTLGRSSLTSSCFPSPSASTTEKGSSISHPLLLFSHIVSHALE